MGSNGGDVAGSHIYSGSMNTSKNQVAGGNLNSSSRLMFNQKEPYIEINFKHGMSMHSTLQREATEDLMTSLKVMQDEGKIGKALMQKSSRQNFKAAKIFTLNDRVIQP